MKERILRLLSDHPWAETIHYFDSIESTNTKAKYMAQSGAKHGTVLLADRQTGGRGRMGRSFCSPSGMGIYLSVILRPACRADQLMHLTCAVAVAMCHAVEQVAGFRPGVKWINDLMANGKKLGGILTEMSITPGTAEVDFAVVGIGINCNQRMEDFPEELQDIATSLEIVTGNTVDRCQLAVSMVRALQKMGCDLLSQKEEIMQQYRADCTTLGQEIYLLRGDNKIPCRAVDLDANGSLIVTYPDRSSETIHSGEVSVRPQ